MQNLTDTFAALGEPTRFAIVERLLSDGELPVSTLRETADISAPAISRHLKVLRKAGVIQRRVDKQRRLYSVRQEAVQSIETWTSSHRNFWETSLDRLALALNEEGNQK
jgi:DNA-binding transcriptional ArsR family regulator